MNRYTALPVIILILVLVATTAGAFYQTTGSRFAYTTVRGEQAVYQGRGLYRYDPAWYVRKGVTWDFINLLIGIPLLAAAIYLVRRNSLRGRLLLMGLLFFFFTSAWWPRLEIRSIPCFSSAS